MQDVSGGLLGAKDGRGPLRLRGRAALTCILRLAREDSGQDLVEYALLTAFIGLAGVTVFGFILAG